MKLLSIRDPKIKLLLFSLMHFATDGLCAFLIFSRLYPEHPELTFAIFIGYNVLAFVTQSPVGMIIDKYNKPKLFLLLSVISIYLGYLLAGFCLIAVFFIGIGNSLFHVAGGKYVSDKSGNDISHLGIFVSTGAVGLVIGQKYFDFTPTAFIFFALLTVSAVFVLVSEDPNTRGYKEEFSSKGHTAIIAFSAILIVVFARSFIGKVITPGFEMREYTFLLVAIATALGKAVGGILSKHLGIRTVATLSMLVAAICLAFGTQHLIPFMLGVFVFNFTMPMTLYLANILTKGKEGFAFGTLAAVLAPGYFIAMSFTYSTLIKVITAVLCLVSVAVIAVILKGVKYDTAAIGSHDNT